MQNANLGVGCSSNIGCNNNDCLKTPDFCIKRNDTMPAFKVAISDCDGVVDLTEDSNLVLEASMWFKSKLKTSIDEFVDVIAFADNIGFDQVSVGDVIMAAHPRSPEYFLISSINENEKTINVSRGHNLSLVSSWPKGTILRIFKFMDEPAVIESAFEEITQIDDSIQTELVETFMVYNWKKEQTDFPGCYFFEFKLMKLSDDGDEIIWTKRTPLSEEGFSISVIDSATPNT